MPFGGAAPRERAELPTDRRKCRQRTAAPASPSVIARAKSYKSARDRWVAAGKPMRTESLMAALFAICEACPTGDYIARPIAPGLSGGQCRVCKCGLARERNVANKIAWATEDCPKGHWPAPDKRDPDPDDGRAG